MVVFPSAVLARYPRFSLYNSPYVAHDEGCAIDLYPDTGGEDSRTKLAPSPVAGEVVAVRSVSAPSKPYAVADDHLIVVDTGEYLARMLHVDPGVEPGDRVDVGDSLGELVRSGFFAPWVANHIHLGFRERDANPVRASGSLPIDIAVDIEPLSWDGSGRVVETVETFVMLDSPAHPAPGERFVGIAADDGRVLDGGFPHYQGGGVLRVPESRAPRPRDGSVLNARSESTNGGSPISLGGVRVGWADGRTVTWDDVEILANGTPITGLSLFLAREQFGAKLVCPGHDFEVGDSISVCIH
ncbi:hypothetical protein [Haladaptatus sp. NG-WS-4]